MPTRGFETFSGLTRWVTGKRGASSKSGTGLCPARLTVQNSLLDRSRCCLWESCALGWNTLSGADHDALGPLTFQHIVGDAKELHAKRCNAHSVFQVASQFNCLEMMDSSLTPQDGITFLSRCTVYRNYFATDGDGQAGSGQIDCLSGVGELLDNTGQQYWMEDAEWLLSASRGRHEERE